jgi:hypothetical protein
VPGITLMVGLWTPHPTAFDEESALMQHVKLTQGTDTATTEQAR